MHTEENAKKLWCPMVNHRSYGNKPFDGYELCCIASACAMWRWGSQGIRRLSNQEDPCSDLIPVGYCGLGGKP